MARILPSHLTATRHHAQQDLGRAKLLLEQRNKPEDMKEPKRSVLPWCWRVVVSGTTLIHPSQHNPVQAKKTQFNIL